MCAQRCRALHSAAKQRRFFRVPPINYPEACVPEAVKATFCSKTGPPINSAPPCASRTKIRKWTLECSCVPKGVRTIRRLVCPRRSRPRSAAKQGRSFRVTPINSAPTRCSEATSWERVPPEIGHRPSLKRTFYEKNLTWQNPAFISRSRKEGLGWRILAPDTWEPGS